MKIPLSKNKNNLNTIYIILILGETLKLQLKKLLERIQITIINPDSINCNKKVNKVKWSISEGAINDKSHWLNLVQCVRHLSAVS